MQIVLPFLCIFSTSLALVFAYLYFTNRKEFSRLAKLRNDFMAMMIHELRSPLTIVKSSTDLIRKESDRLTEEQVENLLKQMEDSASGLLDIVNDLLDVSKIEAGKIELFKHATNLVELLENEVSAYNNLAENKNLEVHLQADEENVTVLCDPEKIKQVMNNLLSNAIKFSDQGSIEVLVKPYPEYAQIEVIDNGIGIADEMKPKMFNKFVQARELPVSREKGTGLGLVIVKGIVESHGGKIWIEDNSPRGTKFIFTLPRE